MTDAAELKKLVKQLQGTADQAVRAISLRKPRSSRQFTDYVSLSRMLSYF